MILKTLTRKSATFNQLLNYVAKENALTKDGEGVLLKWNLQGDKVEEWVKEFQANERLRQKHHRHNIKLIHTVISLADGDAHLVDSKVLEAMTLKYISLRGMDARYFAVSHWDSGNPHVHLVENSVNLSGDNRRMSIETFQELKKELQAFQQEQFPELTKSIAEHGKKHRIELEKSDVEYRLKLRNGTFRREILSDFLKQSMNKASDMNSWFSELKGEGYEPYYRGGKLYGVAFEGRKYRFNKLGIDTERIQELEIQNSREQVLSDLRERSPSVDRDIER